MHLFQNSAKSLHYNEGLWRLAYSMLIQAKYLWATMQNSQQQHAHCWVLGKTQGTHQAVKE